MSYGRSYTNFNFDHSYENKNAFSNFKSNPFQRVDRMDVDVPSRKDNLFESRDTRNTNYQQFNFDGKSRQSYPSQFHNEANPLYSNSNNNINNNNNSNFMNSLENKLAREQYHFSNNSNSNANTNNNYSLFNSKGNDYNSNGFSTVKRIKFSNITPNSLWSWSSQKKPNNNFNKSILKTPASLSSNNFQLGSASVASKFTPFGNGRSTTTTTSQKTMDHSFLLKQQERIAIRENSSSNTIQKFSYFKYLWNKIKNIMVIPLNLLKLSLRINLKLLLAIVMTILIFYLNNTPGNIISNFLKQYNIEFNNEKYINIGTTVLLLAIFWSQGSKYINSIINHILTIIVGILIINALFIKPNIVNISDRNNRLLLPSSSTNYSKHFNEYGDYFKSLLHDNYLSRLIDFIYYKPVRRSEDKRKMKIMKKRLLKLENSIQSIKYRLNYKSNRIQEISKSHENNKSSFEVINYYLTIYENLFNYNSLQLEKQKVILKQIENNFNTHFENIISTRKDLDDLSQKIDNLFIKSRNSLNAEVGQNDDEKSIFIKNYIKELDHLFPPQILITWNKNNKDIEIATDLYNTIGQRYFSKKSYEDHFNVQYPSAPTLPLKEFLWKNKELVENLMLKNYQTFISKKSEIIDLLNENIHEFRQQFKSNENIILSSLDKQEFLNSIKTVIFSDVKDNVKSIEEEKLHSSQNHNSPYSTHSIPDYSTALYGASIIDALTTETQPITSENSMINRLHIINNPPLLALENSLHPNNCWAMKGTNGSLGIKLSHYIYPTAVTIEHLPSWNARDPLSAPKSMTLVAIGGGTAEVVMDEKEQGTTRDKVIPNNNKKGKVQHQNNFRKREKEEEKKKNDGSHDDYEHHYLNLQRDNRVHEKIEFPYILGTFQYNIHLPESSQTFPLSPLAINRLKLYDLKVNQVQLQIHSNWGNENYTCIYRVRVHGDEPQSPQTPLIPL